MIIWYLSLSDLLCLTFVFIWLTLLDIILFSFIHVVTNGKISFSWLNNIPLYTAWSLSHVWLFVTPLTVGCQDHLSMGILQAGILEWVAVLSSRGSSQPRDRTQVSCIRSGFFMSEPPGKPKNTGVVAYPFSRGSSQPRNLNKVSCIAGRFFTSWATSATH